MTDTFTLRAEDLAHETIESETIVIDLLKQAYYRLEGPAAHAWQLLAVGCSAAGMTQALQALYPAEAESVAAAVPAFLDELKALALVVPAGGEVPALPALPATGGAFTGLAIHGFADLDEILWIDPVHDVDEATGWPSLPSA